MSSTRNLEAGVTDEEHEVIEIISEIFSKSEEQKRRLHELVYGVSLALIRKIVLR